MEAARQRLDAWVREVIEWHFDPATGCPFWLNWAARAGWDPRKDVYAYADLDKFGGFQDEWLRGGPVRQWVPKGCAGKPVTLRNRRQHGCAQGAHQHRRLQDRLRELQQDAARRRVSEGADWILIGPSGPRRLRLAVEHLCQHRGGICFGVDLDPRWVIKLLKRSAFEEVELYKRHVIDQALTLMKAHDNIKCIFTTPKLLEALCERVSLKKLGVTGVFCGGTEMTPQFHRFAVEELLGGVYFAPTYGNTLMGLATHKPPTVDDNWAIIYFPPAPRAMIEVVDPDEPTRLVGYGETGRVRLTTLTKEFFMPRFLERDEAEREAPCRSTRGTASETSGPSRSSRPKSLKAFIDG